MEAGREGCSGPKQLYRAHVQSKSQDQSLIFIHVPEPKSMQNNSLVALFFVVLGYYCSYSSPHVGFRYKSDKLGPHGVGLRVQAPRILGGLTKPFPARFRSLGVFRVWAVGFKVWGFTTAAKILHYHDTVEDS